VYYLSLIELRITMKTKLPSSVWFPRSRNHVASAPAKQILFAFAFTISIVCPAQPQLIKDINTAQDVFQMEYERAVDCNGILYFTSNYGELWRTKGQTSGAVLIKKFQWVDAMISYAGAVYFAATQNGEGLELWRSTGASYSTLRLKDIYAGENSSQIAQLTVSGKFLFFVANNGTNGKELWRTDGTSAGTVMVKDIIAKGGSSNPGYLKDINGMLYFAANDGVNGYELWKSDGTAAGTVMVKDIKPGSRLSSSPAQITNVNGVAFFTADDGVTGRELWKSDGSAAGTLFVKDFVPGPGSGNYRNITGVNNTLFFSANDQVHGEEVWKSDGTSAGTVMVKDLYPGGGTKPVPGVATSLAALRNFTSVYGKLYFTGFGPNGYYFWKTDGTSAGTVPLKVANHIGGAPVTAFFTPYNGSVIFCDGGGEQNDVFSYHVQKEDAAGGITTLATLFLNDFYSSRVPFLVNSGNRIFFTGRKTLTDGYALFKTAGTAASTQFVADTYAPTLASDPTDFLKIGGNIYFTAQAGAFGLWKTNGTSAGTVLLKELAAVQSLTNVNGQLFFAALIDGEGWYIHRSDGTPAGTIKIPYKLSESPHTGVTLTNVNGTLYVSWGANQIMTTQGTGYNVYSVTPSVDQAFALGNYLYFQGTDNVNGSELWRTNGTALGTTLIKNINATGSSDIAHFAALNGVLYFSANDGVHGAELWRSNGTLSGTFMVKDVRTGDTDIQNLNDLTDIVAVGNQLYFFTTDQLSQPAIWKSGGTSANTLKVANVPMLSSFMVSNLRLYFTTFVDGSYDLWKSDGTAETTEQLTSSTYWYVVNSSNVTIDGVFYSNLGGDNLWRSDGTSCGTFLVPTVGGKPSPISFLSDELIFPSDDMTYGRELFKISVAELPESPCATLLQESVSIIEEGRIQNYPNPFTDSFTLKISGDDLIDYNISIVDMVNNVVDVRSKMKYNESQSLGAELPRGLYVLKIREGDKVSVMRILKR
jgi:ELWxxDGT repeat protein